MRLLISISLTCLLVTCAQKPARCQIDQWHAGIAQAVITPQTPWVCGYAHDMAAYIPSRRVWEEGGYEGGPHLDEYGRPAWRWSGDVEDRIAGAVHRVVRPLNGR